MTLSDKRGIINKDENGENMFAYHEKDVREFIKDVEKLPKKVLKMFPEHKELIWIEFTKDFTEMMEEEIRELAGDKLI